MGAGRLWLHRQTVCCVWWEQRMLDFYKTQHTVRWWLQNLSVVRQWDKTYSSYGSRQTVASSSDSVLCLMRTAHARFLSDTTHCPMMTSKPVCRTTMPSQRIRALELAVRDDWDSFLGFHQAAGEQCEWVSEWVGILSQVNHKGLHHG